MLASGAFGACDPPAVSVTLADPRGLRSGASFAEFMLFADGCPDEDDLREGSYPDPVADQRLDAVDEFDALGTLDARRYGFAAVLRTEDCAVVGVGCAEADLSKRIDSVIIPLVDVFPPEGACPGACSDGRCDDEEARTGAGAAGRLASVGGDGR